VITFMIAIALEGSSPDYTDNAQTIKNYYADNHGQYLAGDYIIGIAFVLLFLPFLVCFTGLLSNAEGRPSVWSLLALLGGLLFSVLGAVSGAASGALAVLHGNVSDDTAKALQAVSFYGQNDSTWGVALMLLGASYLMVRTGVFWKWLGWAGLAFAVLAVITAASPLDSDPVNGTIASIGFIPFIGSGLWIIACGVKMIMMPSEPAEAGRAAVTAGVV
jgi:hypothetical protein